MATNTFNIRQIKIDEKLEGVRLACFSKRSFAFLVDWLIIALATQWLWLSIPLLLAWVLLKKSHRQKLMKSRILVRYQLRKIDRRLEDLHVHQEMRRRFNKYVTIYLQVLMYAPIVIALLVLSGVISGYLRPQADGGIESVFFQESTFTDPFAGSWGVFNLLSRFFGAFLYFSLFTWRWKGQTPGKRLMNIRVIKLSGEPLKLWPCMERFTGYAASASLLLYGFFQFFWDNNHQTTHDKISETIVAED